VNARAHVVDQIMAVMDEAFDPAYGEAWNRRQISDALAMPATHVVLVDASGAIIADSTGDAVGFVMSRQAADEEELLLIAVLPRYRERGLGRILIEGLFAAAARRGARRIFLEMRRGNPAQNLYQTVGFAPIGERPNYYRMADGSRIDAITFCRLI
jgi:ribosomal-protein-alanine N-acetyltransferase